MRNNSTRWCPAMLAVSSLSACASAPEFATAPISKPLVLEEALVGRTLGDGVFVNSLTGGETTFSVVINGAWDGHILTLVEDFTYGDGSKDRKTWHLTKTNAVRYQGTREDVVGSADVRQDGQSVRLDYYVTLRTGLGGIDVRFQDLLYLQDDGTITNKAVVSKYGLRIGSVEITMRPGQHDARTQLDDDAEKAKFASTNTNAFFPSRLLSQTQ